MEASPLPRLSPGVLRFTQQLAALPFPSARVLRSMGWPASLPPAAGQTDGGARDTRPVLACLYFSFFSSSPHPLAPSPRRWLVTLQFKGTRS